VLTVQDPGLGIAASDRTRIFERFGRGENVTGKIPGTGIGLAGVRQIVEQHGGTVAVDSHEGAGSIFTVRLPLGSP
jgi:signal transduction histidine kinase